MPNTTASTQPLENPTTASTPVVEVLREYTPLPEGVGAHGVAFDGTHVWVATGERLVCFEPDTGEAVRSLDAESDAGTAFDGRHLYQLAQTQIHKLDPQTGTIVASIPAPGKGGDAGLTWAEGKLWVGQHRDRKIFQVDPETGEVLRTLESDRFVTGVTWDDGALWHGTWEGEESELRRVDSQTGAVLTRAKLPRGMNVSGLASDGKGTFFCGGGSNGKVRAVRRPAG